jgi:hypothetical protein
MGGLLRTGSTPHLSAPSLGRDQASAVITSRASVNRVLRGSCDAVNAICQRDRAIEDKELDNACARYSAADNS